MVRQPAVAGQFYTSDAAALGRELLSYLPDGPKSRALGVVVPHAGYVYSGRVAAEVYGRTEIPDTVLILGPNHHGLGSAAALYPAGEWLTPLGATPVNGKLSKLILRHVSAVTEDAAAHRLEHSLEVQLPFLQQLNPGLSIAALCLSHLDFDSCRRLGEGIAGAISDYGAPVLLVASSDLSHYESAEAARLKDEQALSQILKLDPEGLLNICHARRITMCGVVPTAVMLVAAKALGAASAQLIRYAHSGEVNGDRLRVVGYAGVTVS